MSQAAHATARYRLDLTAIEASLRAVQREFPKINEQLQSQRDSMTDAVVENLIAGYTFIDTALHDQRDLLSAAHLHNLLELNHIVLCGLDPIVRQEHHKHLDATAQRFYDQEEGFDIGNIFTWYHKHANESPWKRAAGVYVRILSQPQLYIEGNHRTGALIMSYLLAREGKSPFVLTVDNAKAYFDPSTLIKQTKKTTTTLLAKLPRMKKRFAAFLHAQAGEHYLYKVP
jgi:hypothetical protein